MIKTAEETNKILYKGECPDCGSITADITIINNKEGDGYYLEVVCEECNYYTFEYIGQDY